VSVSVKLDAISKVAELLKVKGTAGKASEPATPPVIEPPRAPVAIAALVESKTTTPSSVRRIRMVRLVPFVVIANSVWITPPPVALKIVFSVLAVRAPEAKLRAIDEAIATPAYPLVLNTLVMDRAGRLPPN
jgi:hypothetical protein